ARTPDIGGTNFMFDMRERHGVMIVVSVMDASESTGRVEVGPDSPQVARRSRFGAGVRAPPPRSPRRSRFGSVVRDQMGVVSRVDDAFTAILGWTDEDLVGHRL